ncbi:vps13A [Symbiodinium pilosum]|uniref:Vps13A protein n=1 Tax=Symbiodinium pilosum TaxID=2952 RepID=A0A812PG76_SYMPI|nr:vps13A [Symbiodinium pilosum]
MVFMNSLPFGPLGLEIASRKSSQAVTVAVEALQRVNFYTLSMQVGLEGSDVVEVTENVQGDEVQRVVDKGLGHLEVFYQGAKLPSRGGITLLHAGCFENPCDLALCSVDVCKVAACPRKMPPNFESFVWNTPSGSLEMTLRIGSVKSSSVHGATCMQFTLAPRLVVTNASDVDLELETPDKMKIRWRPSESRVLHWKASPDAVDPLATTFRFRPIGASQCEFSGVVLCSDGSAGSTPFTLKRQKGGVEVWSVDVAPLHGSMGVLIRPGSDFIAANLLEHRCKTKGDQKRKFWYHQARFELNVKLGRAGISLIDESPPRPCELFFFSLDMLRLEYLKASVNKCRESASYQTEPMIWPLVWLDINQLQKLPENLDLLLSAAQLDVDKLDFTVDEKWLTPLQHWLSHSFGSGGFDLFGVAAEQLLAYAGKPITDGYVAPDVPAVVQAEDVKLSAVDMTVWCSLRLKYLEFLPVYVRTALKVLSFSSYFTLDGVGLALPAKHLEPHRGSLQDYAMTIASDYATSILGHLASLLGKSSLLNLPKAPLKLGGAVVAVMGDKLTDVTTGASSLLRNLTMDDEYIAKNREKQKITGANQGFAAAGKTLMDGVEGMFDVVTKPMEGAKKDGFWGFAQGLTKGVAGTIVKPVAAIGTAIGEVGTGLASTTNTLNDNEANQRRRARRRLRLPRLLFGELGEVRPFVDFEAQLYHRYGENIRGVCEVVVLDREEKGGDLLVSTMLLFADQLAVAVASNQAADAVPNKFERIFGPLKSSSTAKAATLRGIRFSQLREDGRRNRALSKGGTGPLIVAAKHFKAGLSEAAKQALLSGLNAAAKQGRLEAHRTWAQLRTVRQTDERE